MIYEDNHLLVVNKHSGMLSQGDDTGDKAMIDLAKDYIGQKYNKPGNVFAGLCHRLDRPVSGVLIMARTSKALARVNKMFGDGAVEKTYLALSHAKTTLAVGTVDHYLVKDRARNRIRLVPRTHHEAKRALTHYRRVSSVEGWHMYELQPVTGRSHQLRVAMQHLGAPILGDLRYSGKPCHASSIELHCRRLSLLHPVSQELMHFVAPLPDRDPWVLFEAR